VGVKPDGANPFKKGVIVCPDKEFAEEVSALPVCLYYRHLKGFELDLVDRVLAVDPDVILVRSGGVFNSKRVCKNIQRKCNAPIIFVNNGEYPKDLNFEGFADVDVNEPVNLRDLTNLGIEMVRLAYGVPIPSVKISTAAVQTKERLKWIITAGLFIAILSGAMLLGMSGTIEEAVKGLVTTFSAIMSVEIGALVQRHIRRKKLDP